MTRHWLQRRQREQGGVLAGCLIALGVAALLVVIGVIILIVYWRPILVSFVRPQVVAAINQSDLPEDEKKDIITHVDRLFDAFKDNQIDMANVEKAVKQLENSPLLHIGAVYFVEAQYIKQSGLPESEKADARLALQRVARGVYEEKISEQQLEKLLAMVQEPDPNDPNNKRIKETLTDQELRDFVTEARKIADENNIPDEEFKVSIAAEVGKIVDVALGKAQPDEKSQGGAGTGNGDADTDAGDAATDEGV